MIALELDTLVVRILRMVSRLRDHLYDKHSCGDHECDTCNTVELVWMADAIDDRLRYQLAADAPDDGAVGAITKFAQLVSLVFEDCVACMVEFEAIRKMVDVWNELRAYEP